MQQNNLQIQTNGFLSEKEESENKNYTIFELGEKKYAIETKNVLEINKIMEFDYPNKMPSYVLGLIQFDQSPIGVIDLREVFKTDRVVYDLNAKIIIVQIDKTKENIAFICDRVLDITKLPSAKIHSIPYQENGSIYNGLFIDKGENAVKDNPIVLIDTDKPKLVAYFDTKFRENLSVGSAVIIKPNNFNGKVFGGIIESIAAEPEMSADKNSQVIPVTIRFNSNMNGYSFDKNQSFSVKLKK